MGNPKRYVFRSKCGDLLRLLRRKRGIIRIVEGISSVDWPMLLTHIHRVITAGNWLLVDCRWDGRHSDHCSMKTCHFNESPTLEEALYSADLQSLEQQQRLWEWLGDCCCVRQRAQALECCSASCRSGREWLFWARPHPSGWSWRGRRLAWVETGSEGGRGELATAETAWMTVFADKLQAWPGHS